MLLIKAGKIGKVISVDSTCTSIRETRGVDEWNSIHEWGPTALLPLLQILGTDEKKIQMAATFRDEYHDSFAKLDFTYEHAVGTIKVGDGFKSEGELIISGSKGYIYVPAPWWKTDYFEVRYENQGENKRYFYQLDGEGIRYELVAFARAIERGKYIPQIDKNVTLKIAEIMEQFKYKKNLDIL